VYAQRIAESISSPKRSKVAKNPRVKAALARAREVDRKRKSQ